MNVKKLRITIQAAMIVLASVGANAQGTNGYTAENRQNKTAKPAAVKENEFSQTDIVQSGRSVSVFNLPELPRPVWAIITNSDGEVVRQLRISSMNPEINLARLESGLYFLNVVYRDVTKRAFTLKIDPNMK